MTWIMWVLLVFSWVMAVAFAVSALLTLLAVFHFRKDQDSALVCMLAFIAFSVFSAGLVYAAIAIGRGLL